MAKATKWASQKPVRTRTKKAPAAPKRPEPEAVPDTREGLIGGLATLCDEVDAQLAEEMAKQGDSMHRPARSFGWQSGEPWGQFADRRNNLRRRLEDLLERERGDAAEQVELDSILTPALQVTEPGVIPSLARPGAFLLWIGWAPVLVTWGGYITASIELAAVDPLKPWMNERGIAGTERLAVLARDRTPSDVCRRMLTDATTATQSDYRGKKPPQPTFKIVPLKQDAREEVGARLAEAPWLQAALKQGPVNAIPMPKHIKSVQMALA